MQRRLLTFSDGFCPASALVRAHRLYHHSSGRVAIGGPSHRLLAHSSASPSSSVKPAVGTRAEADVLVQRWCTPAHTHTSTPPTGVDLVVCVAGAILTDASDLSGQTHMNALVRYLASTIVKTSGGPKKAVAAWCADVEEGKISGESLVFALNQVERVLVYGYGEGEWMPTDTSVDTSGPVSAASSTLKAERQELFSSAAAKELALTLMAARIALEGIILDRVAATSATSTGSTGLRAGTPTARAVDEFTTSVPRVLHSVEHLYWSVCAPVPAGEYPVPPPPLHDIPLVTDVGLSRARQLWWKRYARTLTAPVLRPLILSAVVQRGVSQPGAQSQRDDAQAMEAFTFTLRVVYGLFGRYESLTVGQRIDFCWHVLLPYLLKDASFLFSACWHNATVRTKSAATPFSTPKKAAVSEPKAKTRKGKATPQSPASGAPVLPMMMIGGEKHNQMTLLVLALLLLVGYIASVITPLQFGVVGGRVAHGDGGEKNTSSPSGAAHAEGSAVSAVEQKVDYQQLLSAIKIK